MSEQTEVTSATTETPTKRARKPAAAKAKAKKAAPKTKAKKTAAKRAKKAAPATGLIQADLSRYSVGEGETAGGNKTVDIGDTVAEKLRGKDIDQVYGIAAKALKVAEGELRKQYKHLNLGMQRMNLGNRMRGAANAKA